MGRGDKPVDPTAMGIIPETETPKSPEEAKAERKARILELSRELVEGGETFPFPGVPTEFYERTKIEEVDFVELELVTPIDVLLEKFKKYGMKVVVGDSPNSLNVFVIPAQDGDSVKDSILIQRLEIDSSMDQRIIDLIEVIQRKV